MSTSNPTALKVGMTGMLDGKRYTVKGRVVLSVEVDGETYYWNEYRLVSTLGDELTLVYEEEEDTSPWKIFRMFEPLRPLSASEAAEKKVGNTVNFGEVTARVTLVDESRVVHVEGELSEGVEKGDVAKYFNAKASAEMIVVSWTGEEVEYYRGGPTSRRRIETAFGLPVTKRERSFSWASSNTSSSESSRWTQYLSVALIVFFLIARGCEAFEDWRYENPPAPPPPTARRAAPATRLPNGVSGRIGNERWTVSRHALVEIGRVGGVFERHEYVLVDGGGQEALLVQGLRGDAREWYLLRLIQTTTSPYDAARDRAGQLVEIASQRVLVTQLFVSKRLDREGGQAVNELWGAVQYGWIARAGDTWFVARWTENDIQLWRGEALKEDAVYAAFSGRAR